jgi:hypothetical protein
LKKFILLLILASIVPTAALAVDQLQDNPHWSVEVKGGKFAPVLADWATFYGKRDMTEYGASLAYKLRRQIEFGVEASRAQAKGQAFAPIHGTTAGDVTYQIYPVNVFILLRGVLSDGQWFVPYAGGGFTRMYYREKVEGQDTVKGSADGYHVRGGMQFLLDGLDRSGATSMYMDYGVFHTYFFIEAENTSAKVKSISTDIGGTAYSAGLLFEF